MAIFLSNASFETDAEQLLGFHCELHWQLLEDLLAEAIDDQVHRIFGGKAALAAIKELVLADFRRRGFMFHLGSAV